jgi:uncharacterized protein (TIGR01777 family)
MIIMNTKNILIAGGSGLIGQKLTRFLLGQGHKVSWLSRSKQNIMEGVSVFYWDPQQRELDAKAFQSCEVFINLSGENIAASKWTTARKKVLLESRTKPQLFLKEKLSEINFSGLLHISASAIGYYGAQSLETTFDETSAPSNDFMGQTCLAWEQASSSLNTFFARNVILRIGVVLSREGGALKKMQLPFQFGFGAALGTGKQQMPWIHEADLLGILSRAIEDDTLAGTINVVSPNAVTNQQFSAALAKVLHRPFFLPPVPTWVLRALMGEMAVIVLEGTKVSSRRIEAAGYRFKYPDLLPALQNLYEAR